MWESGLFWRSVSVGFIMLLIRRDDTEIAKYTAIGGFVWAELAGGYDAAILSLADADEAHARQRTHMAAVDVAHLDFIAVTVRYHEALNSVDIRTLFPGT